MVFSADMKALLECVLATTLAGLALCSVLRSQGGEDEVAAFQPEGGVHSQEGESGRGGAGRGGAGRGGAGRGGVGRGGAGRGGQGWVGWDGAGGEDEVAAFQPEGGVHSQEGE